MSRTRRLAENSRTSDKPRNFVHKFAVRINKSLRLMNDKEKMKHGKPKHKKHPTDESQ